ncbi:MAG: extracellular solute-binding protein, partial [Alphaproteobacteria bacterium]|nr:extracellular solute-binding protein [Alphaproteobacteria bacterium]
MGRRRFGGLSRRRILKTGAAGLVLTSALGIAPRYLIPRARAQERAPGMTGGPWGFPGAERYQYDESSAAGRAIEGVKKLKAEGKAPEKLVLAMADGAVGSFTKPFPAGAPTVLEVFEKETGVKVELIGVALDDLYAKMMQDVTTEAGLYDIYCILFNYYGDLVDAGGIVPLDDYVAKYAPDWDNPERGTATPELYSLLYKYAGKTVGVSFDGDFWTWYYRKDLFADPAHQKAFADKNGFALRPPV